MRKQYNDYLGHYQMAPRKVITITSDGEQLISQLTGRPACVLQANGQDRLKVTPDGKTPIETELAFERNDDGKISFLHLHLNGRDMCGPKLHAGARNLSGRLETLQGNWFGELNFPGRKMRIGITFFANNNESLGAYISSPDQSIPYIPVSSVRFEDGQLKLQSSDVKAAYQATVKLVEGRAVSIEGQWRQRNQLFPLRLEPVSA